MNDKFTQEELLCALDYDPESGLLTRKISSSNGRWKVGQKVGGTCTSREGYSRVTVCVNSKIARAHQVIWMMVEGYWPNQVDHINGDATDNRWANLREVDRLGNARNMKMAKNNTTGITGVYWSKLSLQWLSSIGLDGKNVHLYCGPDFFEACCARKSAERRLGFHENHGMNRSR